MLYLDERAEYDKEGDRAMKIEATCPNCKSKITCEKDEMNEWPQHLIDNLREINQHLTAIEGRMK